MQHDYRLAAAKFLPQSEIVSIERFGSGHINDTYAVTTRSRRCILQRLNTSVFGDPAALVRNFLLVTEKMREKIALDGGDPERETLTALKSLDGEYLVECGGFWRMTAFIENSFSIDRAENCEDMFEGGRGFGLFMRRLADLDASLLSETIPNFHNTPLRLDALRRAVDEDRAGRLNAAKREVEGYLSRAESFEQRYAQAMAALPLRVTHNDTKINNILFDCATRKALAVIDLDTVMPGLAAFDFGDAIRSGAATADEDTTAPETMGVSVELFEAYARGYFAGAGAISDAERDSLLFGAELMTYECGVRFLSDLLDGDVYFKVARPMHNLDRARSQLALVEDMERRRDELTDAILRASGAAND